jgi:hypothetical protein
VEKNNFFAFLKLYKSLEKKEGYKNFNKDLKYLDKCAENINMQSKPTKC